MKKITLIIITTIILITGCKPEKAPVKYSYITYPTVTHLRIDSDGEYHFTAIDPSGTAIAMYDESPSPWFKVKYLMSVKEPCYKRSMYTSKNVIYYNRTTDRPDILYIPHNYRVRIIED